MKHNRITILALLLSSFTSFADDNAKIETVGVAPKATFMLGDRAALAALLEAGYQQSYRGNLTLAYELTPQNRFKFGGEYLLQNQEVSFVTLGNEQVWVDQMAGGLAYQFLPFLEKSPLPLAFEVSGYYALTPDKKVEETARIAEANTYGTAAGFSFQLPTLTLIDAKARYDNTRFIYKYSENETSEGLGFSGLITQPFGDRVNAQVGADLANLYTNYYGGLNYLIPMKSMALQLGLKAQVTESREGISDAMAGFVTIGLVGNTAPIPAGMMDQTLLDWANQPAVYMPLVLAKADEDLGAASGTAISVSNISDYLFDTPAPPYDLGAFFSYNQPLTFALNVTSGSFPASLSFDTSTGILTRIALQGSLVSFTATVTATANDGATATSNEFTITVFTP